MAQPSGVIDGPPRPALAERRPRVRRSLNVPLLAVTAAALAVLGPAAYLWHRHQMPRVATAMLERADRLEEEQDWTSAAGHLYRYLRLCPEDGKVRARLAQVYDRSVQNVAGQVRAVQFYREAIPLAPPEDVPALRSRMAELLLGIGRQVLAQSAALPGSTGFFSAAHEQAEKLLESNPNDPSANRLLALALYGEHETGELAAEGRQSTRIVGQAIDDAVKLNPGDLELARILATIYRKQPELLQEEKAGLGQAEREKEADGILDEAVARNPQNPEAYLVRYEYRKLPAGKADPRAEADLQAALKLGPDNVKALMAAGKHAYGEAARIRGDRDSAQRVQQLLQTARGHFKHAADLQPINEEAHLKLAQVELADGKPDRAVDVLRHGIEKVGKGSRELKKQLADTLLKQGKLEAAETVISDLEQAVGELPPWTPPRVRASEQRTAALLRGQWLVGSGRLLEAVPILRQVSITEATGEAEDPAGIQSVSLLGSVHAALKQWDLAATSFEKVAAAYEKTAAQQPKLRQPAALAAAAAWETAAKAWENAGRLDAATRDYQQAASLAGTPQRWLDVARAELRRQAQLSPEERKSRWKPFEDALDQASKPAGTQKLKEPWRARLLHAECLVLQGEEPGQREQKYREATDLLRKTESELPQDPQEAAALLGSLVLFYERLDERGDADRALLAIDKLGSAPESACLLRAGLHARRKEYEKAATTLEAGLKTLSPGSKPRLEKELAQLRFLQGRPEEGKALLLAIHENDQTKLEPIVQLADLALEAGRFEELQKWEEKLRPLKGSGGPYAQYFEARRLLAQSKSKSVEDPAFAEAVRLQARIQRDRPAWPPGAALRGMILESQNKLNEAADAYAEAIRLGERRVWVYERLVTVLYLLQRFDEANRYLTRLRNQESLSQTLASLDMSIAVQRNEPDRALNTAQRGVEQRPKDPMARIALGQVRLLRGETDAAGREETDAAKKEFQEAAKEFQEAVRLAPGDPRGYDALFAFHLRRKEPERAREVLGEFSKNVKPADGQRASALAQRYELLGDRQAAEAQHREAIRLDPQNSAVCVRAAAFLAQTDAAEAEKVLRGALAGAPQDRNLRRVLAAVLAGRGGAEASQEAEKLLEPSETGGDAASLDQRLQALLLARRGGRENLRKAIRILEGLVADRGRAGPNDRIQLARLLELDGNLQAARGQYLSVLGRPDPNPAQVMDYIDFLLRHDLPAEAPAWLARLEGAAPNDVRTVSLRARWLKATGRTEEIGKVVEAFAAQAKEALAAQAKKTAVGNKQREAQLAASLGTLYSQLDQHAAAEKWYRELMKLSPERYELLAVALARQGKPDKAQEAVKLCLAASAAEGALVRAATTLVGVLVAGHPNAEECFRLAEPLFTRALQAHGNNADLLASVSTVRILQQRMDEAERLLRQALGANQKSVLVMNNLASLLAEKPGGRAEAFQLIDRAIDAAGPQPALLDTKGWILLLDGKPEESAVLLEDASSSPDADLRFRFHLAAAYERQGQLDKARDAFKLLRRAELDRQILTTEERKMLAKLDKTLR